MVVNHPQPNVPQSVFRFVNNIAYFVFSIHLVSCTLESFLGNKVMAETNGVAVDAAGLPATSSDQEFWIFGYGYVQRIT